MRAVPCIGAAIARALPPLSPTSTASGASRATRPSMSPSRAAAPLLRVRVEARTLVVDASAGAAEELARVGGRRVEDLGDVGELVVERLAQHEHRALVGAQALEQDEEGE